MVDERAARCEKQEKHMASVRGDLILTTLSWSLEADKSQDAILVFRRSDNRKRVNICGRRYAFDERKLQEIIGALSPFGAWRPEGIEAEIDGDGDIHQLTIPRRSTNFGGGTLITNRMAIPGTGRRTVPHVTGAC
jgi:hypothetical protein